MIVNDGVEGHVRISQIILVSWEAAGQGEKIVKARVNELTLEFKGVIVERNAEGFIALGSYFKRLWVVQSWSDLIQSDLIRSHKATECISQVVLIIHRFDGIIQNGPYEIWCDQYLYIVI